MLDIKLFGQPSTLVGGQSDTALKSRTAHRILALLVLRSPRPVARAWLAETLWPENTHEQALANLRQRLSELRQALGAEAGRIVSPAPGSLGIALEGAVVDLLEFDAAMQQGSQASLERAVSLYRGELLEGFAEEWALEARLEREQSYLEALQKLAEHSMSAGDPAAAAGYLRKVVARDPMRESSQRALMHALAEAGEWSEVVYVYRELRDFLYREFNSEPDPETAALYKQLRERARSLSTARSDASTRHAARPIPGLERNHNLPAQTTSFVGRQQDIQRVSELMAGARMVTLTGGGGVGKTRLALEVAGRLLDEYPDGVWLVELAGLAPGSQTAPAVASAMKVTQQPSQPLPETLATALASKRALLLLDNCEHLTASCSALVELLLRRAPQLSVLATSRELLHIPGEQIWRVQPMSHPDDEQFLMFDKAPSGVLEYDSCRLLVERAHLHQPEFALTREAAAAVARICRRLGGIPLAIELAAARTRLLTINEIADYIEERLAILRSSDQDVPSRHRTLEALIDWSFNLLNPASRRILAWLSVFSGGWTLDAADAVCGEIAAEGTILDELTDLVDRSLVIVDHAGAGTRFRLLEMIRLYAADRLAELGSSSDAGACLPPSTQQTAARFDEPAALQNERAAGDVKAARDAHADYYLALAEEAEHHYYGKDEIAWFARLDAERDNLIAAVDWSRSEPEREEKYLRLVAALGSYWNSHTTFGQRRELEIYADAVPRARLRSRAAVCAWVLVRAGNFAFIRSDLPQARQLYDESLHIFQQLEHRHGAAVTTLYLSEVEQDLDRRRFLAGQAVSLMRGDRALRRYLPHALFRLAANLEGCGEIEAAQSLYEECLAFKAEVGDQEVMGSVLTALAWMEYNQYDPAALAAETNRLRGLEVPPIGDCRGDLDTVKSLSEEAYRVYMACGCEWPAAGQASSLGRLALQVGEPDAARRWYEHSLTLRRRLGLTEAAGQALLEVSQAARAQGDMTAARDSARSAIDLYEEVNDPNGLLAGLESLAAAAAVLSRQALAARLFGAAEANRARMQPQPWWWPMWWTWYLRRIERELSAALSSHPDEREKGRRMSLQQALIFAAAFAP